MEVKIEAGWKQQLEQEFNADYFVQLAQFIRTEYKTQTIYPKGKDIFSAFNYCPFDETRVVIIGQDPYHGFGQANGLCFSVAPEIAMPPSLINIFREIETDLGQPMPPNGDLSRWAKQGVLLLNATLTVRAGQAGSHQRKGWETFTDAVIKKVNEEKSGVVFLLWGGYAKKKGMHIDRTKHHVLESGHPSPLSANKGYWFGNRHFSQCNQWLNTNGQPEINW